MSSGYKIWKGSFASNQLSSYVHGRIDVEMPDPFILNEASTLRAAISYTGMYRNSARVLLTLQNSNDGGTSEQPVSTLEGLIGEQSISFKLINTTESKMNGTYMTNNPADVGKFFIKITDSTSFDETQRKGIGGCLIV